MDFMIKALILGIIIWVTIGVAKAVIEKHKG
ncbi:hypothetical protein LCGC14_3148890 [marine sediment metagenome]|uniref:Uncharacterized protein n=1 Tax=marine sediment metagenome TaxID=412755 RepID=A0A0F8VUS0_9ZZZZ